MRRWIILVVGLPIYAFMLMVLGTLVPWVLFGSNEGMDLSELIVDMLELVRDPEWWVWAGFCALIVIGLQTVFLAPVFRRKPPGEGRSKSLAASLVMAGFLAGVLTLALGTAIVSLIVVVADVEPESPEWEWLWFIPVAMFAIGWVMWTFLLLVFVRGIWADRVLGRIVGLLFAGTVVEVLVVIPLDIMIRRRTDCYCGEGTFFTLVLAGFATLWLAGPGVVIALTSKKHRLWRETRCFRCGYAKGPSPGSVCPECGFAWADQ